VRKKNANQKRNGSLNVMTVSMCSNARGIVVGVQWRCAFAKSMGINYTRRRRREAGIQDVESRTVARLSDSHDATIGDAFTSAVAIDDGVASGEFAAAL
jgi:hypothetical protein